MAIKFNRSQTFATNGTVTAPALHNLVDGLDIYQALITDQTNLTSVGTADELLIADADLTPNDAPRAVTVQELFNDALTVGTYTDANFTANLTYGTATGNRTVSTNASITTGTINNATLGTTTSTAATITSGTITNGLIPTLTAGTTTGTAGIFTSGTVATLNSTTGTIGNLSATTSTFLGTITGSTNVINIGSGQIYKDASGNVGIGTTSPSGRLEVSEVPISGQTGAQCVFPLRVTVGYGGTDYGTIGYNLDYRNATDNKTGVKYLTSDTISQLDFYAGGFSFRNASSGTAGGAATLTEHLRIDSSGNVGIGTSSPSGILHVSKANGVSIFESPGVSSVGLRLVTNSIDRWQIGCPSASGDLAIYTGAAATERLRIDSIGNVGIGVTAPVNKLEVVGSFGRGAPVTKTNDFTLADTENWLIVNKGSSCTVTLPAASSWTGREFTIKVITAHAVVSASSNIIPRIGGAATTAILPGTDGAWATLVSNGSNWEIMCGS